MKNKNKFSLIVLSILIILAICSCGGGGGGGGGGASTTPIDTIPPTNGFIATDDNKIEGGQKEFAFGQSAVFNIFGETEVSQTWSSANGGSFDSSGQYFTPKDLSDISEDTITMTSSTNIYSRKINLSPFPSYEDSYFNYIHGNQNYTIKDLTSTQAIAVATFQNNSASIGEGNIKIKNLNAATAKKDSTDMQKLQEFIEKAHIHKDAKCMNLADPIKYSQKKSPKLNKISKSNRASDPIGTRDTFFHDEGSGKGAKPFEKIYSGDKCLIYAEVNTSTDQPYVNQTRGKFIGDAFELSNSYHSTGKAIYDVVTNIFGHPWGIDEEGQEINGGGRDGEKQVLFLIYKGGTAYGFFYWVDEEEKGFVNPADGYISNGAEIVYLNQQYADDDIAILSTVAHEFQHLCDYNQRFILDGSFSGQIFDESFDSEASTLFNEGQSLLSEDINGFTMKMPNNKGNDFVFQVVNNYQATISTFSPSFLSWSGGSDYGKGYLFMRFIYDTYGETTLKAAARSHLIQPSNITSATNKKFDELLQEFLLALIQTDSSQPIHSKIKLTIIDRNQEYFDTVGDSLGQFMPLDYVNGFEGDNSKQIPANVIKNNSPYEIRFYKLLPNDGRVEFTLENIKPKSNYSIFSSIINK